MKHQWSCLGFVACTCPKPASTEEIKVSKPMTDSKGREVCDVEVEGSGCDAFIAKANYLTFTFPDGSYTVPDEELDYLTENYPEYIEEQSFQNLVCAAEYAFEGDR